MQSKDPGFEGEKSQSEHNRYNTLGLNTRRDHFCCCANRQIQRKTLEPRRKKQLTAREEQVEYTTPHHITPHHITSIAINNAST